MVNFYLQSYSTVLAKHIRQPVIPVVAFFVIVLPVKLFAQAPTISYSSPQTYTAGAAITSLVPASSGVAAPGYNASTLTLGSGFAFPTGVAVDAGGNIYVADQGHNAVKKIPVGGGAPVTLGSLGPGFNQPFGVAVDAAGFNVYVADRNNNAVKQIPFIADGPPAIIGSGFHLPTGVAVDEAGNVYVADQGNHAVKEIPAGGGSPVTIGSGFNSPAGVAVDAAGNVYVADQGNNAIYKIPVGGGAPVTLGSGFFNPSGVAVDAASNVYVADFNNNAVKEIPVGGGAPVTIGSGFTQPYGVAVDGAGKVYLADYGNSAIKEIKPVGGYYISPSLPAGLRFDSATGIISGTPTAGSPATNYTITAYNSSGSSTATVNIKVLSNISYTWTGAGSNRNWSNNNNWTPSSGHPVDGDIVFIGTTLNAPTVDVISACSSIAITGATTLTLSAPLNISGGIKLQAPLTVSGTGNLTAGNLVVQAGRGLITKTGSNLNFGSIALLTNAYIQNGGTMVANSAISANFQAYIVNSGAFTVNAGNISLGVSAYIYNLAGSVFNANGSPSISMHYKARIANAGIFNISGAAIKMGNSGYINNISGATFTINGGSTIDFAADSASAAFILNSGTFYAGTSNSSCTVNLNYSGVSIQNNGIFYLGSSSLINLTGFFTSLKNSGTFTLQSDATGTASIGNISGGFSGCFGNYNVERFITGGNNIYRGYRLLSSPVNVGSGIYSINYLKNSSYLTGTTSTSGGFDNAGVGSPTLFLFRENLAYTSGPFLTDNFRSINNINSPPVYSLDGDGNGFNIPVGNGFLFFFRGDRNVADFADETTTTYVPTNTILTATGILNQGKITVKDWYTPSSSNLGFTNTTGNGVIRGFNLAGNPYPSSIDWDTYNTNNSTSGIYAPNVSPFMYIFDPVSKNYSVYQAGNGGTGGTIVTHKANIIPSGQGFFVIATNASASLIFNESAKTSAQANGVIGNLLLGKPVQAGISQYLHLKLAKDSINTDGIFINFNDSAKPQYIVNEDAPYKPGNGMVSLSSMSGDGVALAINTLALPKQNQTISLNVSAHADGAYQLNMATIKSIPELFDIWLIDAYKKDSLNFRHNQAYSFNIIKSDAASYGSKRFSLVIRQNPALAMHLLDFTATKVTNVAQIVWKTENEQNYTNFTVERSTDNGVTFDVLGGFSSNAGGTYSFLDKNPHPIATGTTTDRYRLKLEDFNGTISYSKVVKLIYSNLRSTIDHNISVYPNPANNVINLSITENTGFASDSPVLQIVNSTSGITSSNNTNATSYDIKITNITGTVIKTATSPQANWQYNVSNLLPGTYIIQVMNNSDKSLVGKGTFIKL